MKQIMITLALVCMISLTAEAQKKQKKDKTPQTCTFSVNMDCEGCVDKITKQLAYEKGVKDLDISLEEFTVAVTYRPDKTDKKHLAESIKKLGYEVKEVKKEKKPEKESEEVQKG